jgi:hypothetical protein
MERRGGEVSKELLEYRNQHTRASGRTRHSSESFTPEIPPTKPSVEPQWRFVTITRSRKSLVIVARRDEKTPHSSVFRAVYPGPGIQTWLENG